MCFDKPPCKRKSRKSDPVLLYERVKCILINGAYAAERNPLLGFYHGSASRLSLKIRKMKLTAEQVLDMSPSQLAEILSSFVETQRSRSHSSKMLEPDFPALYSRYLKSRMHDGKRTTETKLELTRKIIYEDYYDTEENRAIAFEKGLRLYSISHFYKLWTHFIGHEVVPTFRKPTSPGLQSEFDFCGVTLPCEDGTKATFAVLVLNHSRMCYVEAIRDQSAASSAAAIVNGFRFFGGVTTLVSIDNFKAAVKKAGVYGGELTDAYRMLEGFLRTSFVSMQVRRGDLKGVAESHVKLVTHTLLARMRQEMRDGKHFKDLNAMNSWLKDNLYRINSHRVRGLTFTRQELWEEEKLCLKPLPQEDFSLDEICTLTVPKTARITVGMHQYALPPALIGRKIQMRKGATEILFYEDGHAVCGYQRQDDAAGVSVKEGFLTAGQLYMEVLLAIPDDMLLEWAGAIGLNTRDKVTRLLSKDVNTDRRRAVIRLLTLCQDHPAWYESFDTMLGKIGHHRSVSFIAAEWNREQKPDTHGKDPVYRFDYVFNLVKGILEGQKRILCWDHHTEERSVGKAFMHYKPTVAKEPDRIGVNVADHADVKNNDPKNTKGENE